MLWDFTIRTDHDIETRRPDLLIIDKKAKNCQILDVAIDGRVRAKEGEKVEIYQDLAKEIRMM